MRRADKCVCDVKLPWENRNAEKCTPEESDGLQYGELWGSWLSIRAKQPAWMRDNGAWQGRSPPCLALGQSDRCQSFCLKRAAGRITWPLKAIFSWRGPFSPLLFSRYLKVLKWLPFTKLEDIALAGVLLPRSDTFCSNSEFLNSAWVWKRKMKVWTSSLNPRLAPEPPFLLWCQVWYDRAPFITQTPSPAPPSLTLSLPLTLGQTERFPRGELSTRVTLFLMLTRVPKRHKRRRQPGIWTCQRRCSSSLLGTAQSFSFQGGWGVHLISEYLIPLGDFKTTTTRH